MDDFHLIGWREWLALPQLGLLTLKAKIDTGARSSALHVDDIKEYRQDGVAWLRFTVVTGLRGAQGVPCAAPVFDRREVSDSGGHVTRRWFIRTPIRLAGIEWDAEIN